MHGDHEPARPRPDATSTALDRLDLQLLAILQDSSELTNQQLSERLPLSPSQCSRRRERLREMNIIEREAALLNPRLIGLKVKAFVFVTLSEQAGEARELHLLVKDSPEILECVMITGMANFLMEVYTQDLKHLRELVLRICNTKLVQNVKSCIVLNEQKSTTAIPLGTWR